MAKQTKGQKKNSVLQSITHTTKDLITKTTLKPGVNTVAAEKLAVPDSRMTSVLINVIHRYSEKGFRH